MYSNLSVTPPYKTIEEEFEGSLRQSSELHLQLTPEGRKHFGLGEKK